MAVTDKQKSAQLLRRYGITLSEYDLLMTLQEEACAICKLPETARDPKSHRCIALAVDHDHATGAIRGLLCSKCNRALGYLNDDINLLLAGVAYISRHMQRKPVEQNTTDRRRLTRLHGRSRKRGRNRVE